MYSQVLNYAGDIPPREAWQALLDNPQAVLVDVRTPEEWAYVGVVDTTQLGRDTVYVPWAHFPQMTKNTDFVDQLLRMAQPQNDTPIYFLCRSGHRSAFAAHTLSELGFTHCYNITEGFEGDPDKNKHRGSRNGWKVAGLPWVQG